MITSDLIEYIKGELNDNVSKDFIISTLLETGWKKEDIEEGFSEIKQKENSETKKSFDPYRELAEEGDPMSLRRKAELEDENIETKTSPTGGSQILDLSNLNKPIDLPIIDTTTIKPIVEKSVEVVQVVETHSEKPVIEVTPPEMPIAPLTTPIIIPVQEKIVALPVVETPIVSFTMPSIVIPPNEEKTEVNNVWVPTTIKPIEVKKEIEVFNLEIREDKEQTPIIPKVEIKESEKIMMEPIIIVSPKEDKKESAQIQTELIPSLNKAPSIASMGGVISGPVNTISIKEIPMMNNISGIVSNKAMLSSFSNDIVLATKEEEVIPASPNKKKNFLKLGIFIMVLTLIAGMVFAFVEGYIKIPGSKFNLFVVKKDPKTTLLNGGLSISKLKSFKTQTNIKISSPSLSSITTGLSSGEAVNTKDKDSISIDAKGIVNNINDKSVFDYLFDVKSSILDSGFTTNLKYNNGDLLFSVPDLTPILGDSAPEKGTVSASRDQLGLIIKELPVETQNLVKKLDIYNIISMEVPLYVKNETAGIMKEFINTFEYVNKGEESIRGVETTHYGITVTRASTKKFLGSLANLFIPQLSAEEKKNLDEAIGAANISSFEVWVGKNDDNIYQFKFTLSAPLSKVLRLNDSGIADNEVKLDWITTFYDLDIENKIVIPNGEVNMDGFIKNIQNIKIKNTVFSFKSQTLLFKNAVGSYGKSNTLGSCTAPVSGSLFSPLGHPKGADTAVSAISTTMNSLLAITKNEGSCYSTNKAWALAVPLNTEPVSYYCIDSAGVTTTLLGMITGPVCVGLTPVVPAKTTPSSSDSVEKTTNTQVAPQTSTTTN